MKKIISFLFLIGLTLSYIVSIDSCAKYAQDGRQCRQCISGFQLLNNTCYPRVKGCTEYGSDGQCSKCQPKTFLEGNRCCDKGCFEKLLIKNPNSQREYPIEENYQKMSELIEMAENELPDNVVAWLIWLDIRELNGVERWFLLYRIQNSNDHYQRIVLDSNDKLKSLQNSVVDSSFARIPDEFNVIQWKEVENTQAVLKLFPALYSDMYSQVSAKIAVLSEVQQFEIVTISEDIVSIRVLYQLSSQIVILEERLVPVRPTLSPETSQQITNINSAPSTPVTTTKTPQNSEQQPIIIQDTDGCTTHTTYEAPFSGEILALADKLTIVKDSETLKQRNIIVKPSTTPIIGNSFSLFPRRIVATQPCLGSQFREIAVVRGDGFSSKEYFDYFIQMMDPENPSSVIDQAYAGSLNKTQPTQVYARPNDFPMSVVDPSIRVFPNASYYFQRGVVDAFRRKLNPVDARAIMGVRDDPLSEVDRLMGDATRFMIDGVTVTGGKIRKMGMKLPKGWLLPHPPRDDMFDTAGICMIAPEMAVTQSYVIGDSGRSSRTKNSSRKPGENKKTVSGKVTYTGVDIEAELDVNQPLIAVVQLLRAIPNWDFTLNTVQEESKSGDIIVFYITASNSNGVVKTKVTYSRSKGNATLVKFGQKGVQAEGSSKSQKSSSGLSNGRSVQSGVNPTPQDQSVDSQSDLMGSAKLTDQEEPTSTMDGNLSVNV